MFSYTDFESVARTTASFLRAYRRSTSVSVEPVAMIAMKLRTAAVEHFRSCVARVMAEEHMYRRANAEKTIYHNDTNFPWIKFCNDTWKFNNDNHAIPRSNQVVTHPNGNFIIVKVVNVDDLAANVDK